MSQEIINIGASPNDGEGDPIRSAFEITNTNFTQLFAYPNPTPPTTLLGKDTDVAGMYAYSPTVFYYCFGNYDGVSTIWAEIPTSGSGGNGSAISNGTSNITVYENEDITVTVTGASNVAIFTPNGISLTGNVTAANVVGNYIYGNGAYLTGISGGAGNYSNANVAAYLPTYSGNVSAFDVTAVNTVTANLFIGTFQGNTTGNFVVPGANTQVIYNNNGNAGANINFTYNSSTSTLNVAGVIHGNNITANTISTTGNITGYNILSTGSAQFSAGIFAGNAIVSTGIISATGNLYAGSISSIGNIYADYIFGNTFANTPYANASNVANTVVDNAQPNITTVGTLTTLSVSGNANAGNVYASGYYFANGAPFTTYSDSNVAAYLPTYTGNLTAATVSLTGNLTANNFLTYGNATVSGGLRVVNDISSTGNIRSQGYISATGNIITSQYFVGNFVGNVTGNLSVPGQNTQIIYNANMLAGASAGLTYTSGPNVLGVLGNVSLQGNLISDTVITNNISSNGSISLAGDVDTDGNVSAAGNIIATGAMSASGNIYTTGYFVGNFLGNITGNLSVPGSNTQVLFNANGNAGASAGLTYTSSPNVLTVLGNVSSTGRVFASTLQGTLVTAAQRNITAVGNIATLTVVGTVTGASFIGEGGNISNIAGGNVTGPVTLANTALTAGTITTNAQPNITSVGTLSSLTVTGNTVASGFVAPGGFFKLPSYNQTQINALTGMTGGELVYNTSTNIIQGYQMNPATSTMGWVNWTVAVYQ